MKNILLTSWYTGLGGGETDLLSLAQFLDPAEWTPHLLLPKEGILAEKWREQGWPVHITPYRGASTYFLPYIWARFPVVERMADMIRQHHIDIISTEYHTLPMIHAAAQKTDVPIMWTVHGWWFKPKFWQRDFFRKIPIVARSMSIRDGFLGKKPFMPPENIPVIYSGVDINRFHPDVDGLGVRFQANVPQDAPLVVMIARFQAVKGHHIFQAMAQQIALQIPEAHFIVAGEDTFGVGKDAQYRQQILDTAKTEPVLSNRLHYIGFRDDVEQVLAAADIVVCASEFESYGKVNIEAMASGKAVVSTNRGGPTETIVHQETGFLVESGNTQQFAICVVELLHDSVLRQTMGKNGRQRAEALFSAQTSSQNYVNFFTELLT
jgi:glycosyltransferase involved in cell wall biosynthesis